MRKIKKGDTVVVLVGKDKGSKGRVLRVIPKKDQVVVEGVNIVKKHHKSRGQNDPSRIIEVVKPLHISKVQLVCPHCQKPTRVGIRVDKANRRQRFCKKCQQIIESSGGR